MLRFLIAREPCVEQNKTKAGRLSAGRSDGPIDTSEDEAETQVDSRHGPHADELGAIPHHVRLPPTAAASTYSLNANSSTNAGGFRGEPSFGGGGGLRAGARGSSGASRAHLVAPG